MPNYKSMTIPQLEKICDELYQEETRIAQKRSEAAHILHLKRAQQRSREKLDDAHREILNRDEALYGPGLWTQIKRLFGINNE